MDGFEGNTGVIILAATNRPESLDPALTRPGRFDRRVPVELPDLQGREAILKVHAKKIKVGRGRGLPTRSPAWPPAPPARSWPTSSTRPPCGRCGTAAPYVTQADLEESIEVVIAGYQKKNAVLSDQEKRMVAYHEIGHALVAAMQSQLRPGAEDHHHPPHLRRPGLHHAGGGRATSYLMTKEELENKIATFTGGRAAEEVVFGQISTGASNDIEQATKLARAMITRYGMSEEFDMVAMETVNNQYLGGDASLACSADTQTEIDRQVVELVKTQHEKARQHPGGEPGKAGRAGRIPL